MAKWRDQIINVLDLEATCWENKTPPPGEDRDIIEIGICEFNFKTRTIIKPNGFLCMPLYSKVSPFCTQLTTITQEQLNTEGKLFKTQLNTIISEYSPENRIYASYGEFDKHMIARECGKLGLYNPFAKSIHLNVKTLFAIKYQLDREVGMEKALKIAKIPLVGTHHRGVDDALNIAELLKEIMA